MDDSVNELQKWMRDHGHRTAQEVADALQISRSAADRAIRGEAGDLAMRRLMDRINVTSRLDLSLGAAISARIVVGLSRLGHEVTQPNGPDCGIDFWLDGVPVQVKVLAAEDHGKVFLERLAGLAPRGSE